MSRVLTLPDGAPLPAASDAEALAAWRDYLRFDGPLLLLRSPDRARRLLTQACGVADGEPVGIPVNARRFLSEAVKKSGGTPRFVELDADLGLDPGPDAPRLLWAEPVGGMATPAPATGATLLVDHGLTLPAPLRPGGPGFDGAATVLGLHLGGADPGALVAFRDPGLAAAVEALATPEDRADPARAVAQHDRLAGEDGIAARMLRLDREVRLGMAAGAGMPMADRADGALPYGVPVRVPDEADLPTFLSYVRNELVDLDWLPELQPVFYVAWQVTRDLARTRLSADRLARWAVSPIGPDFVDDEITHAVLGILKAAEYTGVRWFTNPGRARWYGELLVEWYGPDHDAYHPAFAITAAARE